MANYIIMLTLTHEGREKMVRDPHTVTRAENSVSVSGVQVLGLYGVLGDYDFVGIVEAPDNESVARFSIELGAKAGVHVTTMPAIPIGRLENAARDDEDDEDSSAYAWPAGGLELRGEDGL